MHRRWILGICRRCTVICGLSVCGWMRLVVHADDPQNSDRSNLLKIFSDEFVLIAPGKDAFPAKFEMGATQGDASAKPLHSVTLTETFFIAKYEVPQDLYSAVIQSNPSKWKGPRNSVEMVSWDDAHEFCHKISVLLKSEGRLADDEVIRLPTEAEWEYCCRAGTTTRYSFGERAQQDDDVTPMATILSQYGWHTGNAAGNDPPVGALKPNPWGLYDLHGYLWELTADAWSPNYHNAPTDGSAVTPNEERTGIVIRGGSWKDDFSKLTSSTRRKLSQTDKDDAVGFRCVKSKSRRGTLPSP